MNSSSTFIKLGDTIDQDAVSKILEAFQHSRCFYLISPTGTGKSVVMPVSLASSRKETRTRVICAIPTRIAVKAIYDRMNSLSHPSITFGYAADSDVFYKDETSVAFVTTDHLLLRFLGYYSSIIEEAKKKKNSFGVGVRDQLSSSFCDYVILDEVHLGTMSNSIIMQIWQDLNSRGLPVPRLLLMSANDVIVPITKMIKGRVTSETLFTIETRYQPKDRTYNFATRPYELYSDAGKIAADYYVDKNIRGHVLVFGPGKAELDVIERAFNEKLAELGYRGGVNRLTIQSSEDEREQEEADSAVSSVAKNKKIIFSTNAAETSVTILDLEVIVDTLTEKNLYCSSDESPILRTEWISKDSVLQRRGRIGRTRSGIYHMMCNQIFESLMNPHRPLEVERVPLSQTVIRLIKEKLNPYLILSGSSEHRIRDSITLAENLGAIKAENGVNVVTSRGNFCASMPISTRSASFLYDVVEKNKKDAIFADYYFPLLIVSIIENFDAQLFRYSGVDTRDKEAKKTFWETHFKNYVGSSSLETYLEIFFSVLGKFTGDFQSSSRDQLEDHFVKMSYRLHIKKYVVVGILRTYFRLVKAFQAKKIPGDYRIAKLDADSSVSTIITNLSTQLSNAFPIYTRSFDNYNCYFREQDAVEQYRISGNGWYDNIEKNFHQHLIAFSTITIISENESKKISLYCRFNSDRPLVTAKKTKEAIKELEKKPKQTFMFNEIPTETVGQELSINYRELSLDLFDFSSSSNETNEDIVARVRNTTAPARGKKSSKSSKFVKVEKEVKTKIGVQFTNYVASLDLEPLPEEFNGHQANYLIGVSASQATVIDLTVLAPPTVSAKNYRILYDDINPYRYLSPLKNHYTKRPNYPVEYFTQLIQSHKFLVVLYGNPVYMDRIAGLFFTSDSRGGDHYLGSLGTIEQLPNEKMVYYYHALTTATPERQKRTDKVIDLMTRSGSLIISWFEFADRKYLVKQEKFGEVVYYHYQVNSAAPTSVKKQKQKKQYKPKTSFVAPVITGQK